MSLIDDVANAIERYESGGNPNALSYRNNNPGNLRSWGNYPVVGGYVQFPSLEVGRAALRRQAELNIGRGLSLREFFGGKPAVYAGYAPAGDANHPDQYATTVGGWLGIDPDTPLTQLGDENPPTPQQKPAGAGARKMPAERATPTPGMPRRRG